VEAKGLNRRPKPATGKLFKDQGTFRDYNLAVVHIDIKHLPKLQTSNGARRKRHLFVTLDRCSRSVHLAVKDHETEQSATAFLREASAAYSFRLIHVPTTTAASLPSLSPRPAPYRTRNIAISGHARPRTTA